MPAPSAAKDIAIWVAAAFAAGCAPCVASAQPTRPKLEPRWAGDSVVFRAPEFHFIEGRVRQRLLDGATVPLLFQLSVSSGDPNTVIRRTAERFVLSYDLWEEKYSVTTLKKGSAAFSHKSASAAENWCLGKLAVPAAGLPEGRGLWFRLEVRDAENADGEPPAGLANLRGLVDLLSRTGERDPARLALEAGPLTLEQLRKTASP